MIANQGNSAQAHSALSPSLSTEIFDRAVQAHQSGFYAAAEQAYREILASDPHHADALHGLGVLAHQFSRSDIAEDLIRQAVALRAEPVFFNNLGAVLLARGKAAEALVAHYRALELRTAYPEAYNALGNVQQNMGNFEEAIASYGRALAFRPNYAEAQANLGKALHESGRLDAAADSYAKAIALSPDCAEAHNNLGNLWRSQGKHDDAIACFERAIAARPDYAEAYSNRGVALVVKKDFAEAKVAFRRALALKPDFPAAMIGYGSALLVESNVDEAIPLFRRALEIDPRSVEAHNNLGRALLQLDRTKEAVASFEAAIEMARDADCAESYFNLGSLLLSTNKPEEALASFEKALAIKPDHFRAKNNLGCAYLAMALMDEAEEAFALAAAMDPRFGDSFSNRLLTMHYIDTLSNADVLEAALAFGKAFDRPVPRSFDGRNRSPERRLKIGYVSGDFNLHPVGFFLSRSLSAHDRDAFEITCYSNCRIDDNMTEHLRRRADRWRLIADVSDEEVASKIRDDGIDILVDLAGHTGKNRLPMFGLKPAPVQASWLGYVGTTGMATMDYLLLDPISAPVGEEKWYSESLVRLPDSRFCYETPYFEIKPIDPPCLGKGVVTFGCFNNIAKINSGVVSVWAKILLATPDSRLIVKWKNLVGTRAGARLLDQFVAQGVAAERIEFRDATVFEKMLEEYGDVDIALDPFPFGGCTTSCEALWMGVPIVTLRTDRLASRQTFGFLHLLGLDELAATTLEDYIARAISLAAQPQRLTEMRRRQRKVMEQSPLCNGPKFTAALEAAYRGMWRRYVAGQQPEPFDVTPVTE